MNYTVRVLTLYGDILTETVTSAGEALALANGLHADVGSTLAIVEVIDELDHRIGAKVAEPQLRGRSFLGIAAAIVSARHRGW